MLAEQASPRTTLDQITGYVVEYTPEGGTTQDVQEVQVTGAGATTQNLTDLLPNTRYTVQVRAVNGHGNGKRSPYAAARTLPNPRPALGDTSFSIQENTSLTNGLVHIGTLTATDRDPQDSVTGYEIQEIGADHSFFELTPTARMAPPPTSPSGTSPTSRDRKSIPLPSGQPRAPETGRSPTARR